MINGVVERGDIIQARYYTGGHRKNRKGKTIGEGTERTGNFVVLDVTSNGMYAYALMSLRYNGSIMEPEHCFIYDDSHYVVLNMKYRMGIDNIDRVVYHLGDKKEFKMIEEAFHRFSEEHIVHDADHRRQMRTDNSKGGSRTGFHMRYAPTTSISVVSGGSFGKRK